MYTTRLRRVLLPAVLLSIATGLAAIPLPAQAEASCAAFSAPIYDSLNPRSNAQLLTRSSTESSAAVSSGFTHDRGPTFKVASSDGASLDPVHRLRHSSNGDLFYSLNSAEIARATSAYGYRDEGVAFYATESRPSCGLMTVLDYYKGGIHRFITRSAEAASLEANGWSRGRVRFYVGAPTPDPTFSIGVIPDTQQEVLNATDTRFQNRTQWFATNRSALDLRFVTHTGDVVNWDTPYHEQYTRGQSALKVLRDNRVPFSVSLGNHDTAAVCEGGGACDPARTRALVRDTRSSNTYLSAGTSNLGGQFESGKIDNMYSTFTAGGLQWLVLNLELWPRPAVMSWARGVVARHPRHNVIVATHHYLSTYGGLPTSAYYGDTSPKAMYDGLIKLYPNIRLVFSGHVGSSRYRVDTGVKGNKIYSMLLGMHSNTTNPLRVVKIDTSTGTLSTTVSAPYTRQSYPEFSYTWQGVSWVR